MNMQPDLFASAGVESYARRPAKPATAMLLAMSPDHVGVGKLEPFTKRLDHSDPRAGELLATLNDSRTALERTEAYTGLRAQWGQDTSKNTPIMPPRIGTAPFAGDPAVIERIEELEAGLRRYGAVHPAPLEQGGARPLYEKIVERLGCKVRGHHIIGWAEILRRMANQTRPEPHTEIARIHIAEAASYFDGYDAPMIEELEAEEQGPQPNEHGVYGEPTERFTLPRGKKGWQGVDAAEIRLLDLGTHWIWATRFQLFSGDSQGEYLPLCDEPHCRAPDRKSALAYAKVRLVQRLQGKDHPDAKRIMAWLQEIAQRENLP